MCIRDRCLPCLFIAVVIIIKWKRKQYITEICLPAMHGIFSLIPVSYTHLDVYKRQTSGFCNGFWYFKIGHHWTWDEEEESILRDLVDFSCVDILPRVWDFDFGFVSYFSIVTFQSQFCDSIIFSLIKFCFACSFSFF